MYIWCSKYSINKTIKLCPFIQWDVYKYNQQEAIFFLEKKLRELISDRNEYKTSLKIHWKLINISDWVHYIIYTKSWNNELLILSYSYKKFISNKELNYIQKFNIHKIKPKWKYK